MDFNFIDSSSIPALRIFNDALVEVKTLEDKIQSAENKCKVLYRALVNHREFINRLLETILRSLAANKPHKTLTSELIRRLDEFNNKYNVGL